MLKKDYLRAKIFGETEELKSEFVTLVFQLQKSLEKASIPPDDVINMLSGMDPGFIDVLKDCGTIARIFSVMNRYWSFYDYILIKIIINNIGDNRMKDNLKSYIESMKEYCNNRLCDCPINAFGDGKNESSEEVIIKIDDELKNLDLRQMSKLRNEIIKHIGIKYVRLLSIDEGCVRLSFRTLPQAASCNIMLTADHHDFLFNLNVLIIEIYGKLIFCSHSAIHNTGGKVDYDHGT